MGILSYCIWLFVNFVFCYIFPCAARAEIGEFVEYDLDNEDEDWLLEFNDEKRILLPEK